MKVSGYYHGILFKDNSIVLRPSDSRDLLPIRRLFKSKREREERSGKEILLQCVIDAPFQRRTIKELNTAWKLIQIIFEAQFGRRGTTEEEYQLYEDLLPEYAEKMPCLLYPDRLRPVRLSEANTVQAATFIDGLIFHLCNYCDLKQDLQADVRTVIYEFEEWRGKQKKDFTATMTESQWRERAVYSEASGIGTDIDLHHMMGKGAHENLRNDPENWIALNRAEHEEFHDDGEEAFLQKYPHLKGRFDHIHRKAASLYEESRKSLVSQAMEEQE